MNNKSLKYVYLILILIYILSFKFILYAVFNVCSYNIISILPNFKVSYLNSNNLKKCNWLTNGMYDEAVKLYGNNTMDFIRTKLSEYGENTDQITKDHLNYMYSCLENKRIYGKCCPANFYYLIRSHNLYEHDKRSGILDKYIVHPNFEEVFVNYHGFRFARQEIKDYVKNKDFLDIGSYVGDSAVVLSQYTNKNIYSYDISVRNLEDVKSNAQKNSISDKVITINKGLGSSNETFLYLNSDDHHSALHLTNSGNIKIPMTTIDNEVNNNHIIPGLIKADIEGSEYSMLLGAKETIEKYRPIMSISIYHNFNGLFRIPDYIKSFGNYKIFFRACSINHEHMGEMILFAYPLEIEDFDSFEIDNNPLTKDINHNSL